MSGLPSRCRARGSPGYAKRPAGVRSSADRFKRNSEWSLADQRIPLQEGAFAMTVPGLFARLTSTSHSSSVIPRTAEVAA